jgi:hypothetical protein
MGALSSGRDENTKDIDRRRRGLLSATISIARRLFIAEGEGDLIDNLLPGHLARFVFHTVCNFPCCVKESRRSCDGSFLRAVRASLPGAVSSAVAVTNTARGSRASGVRIPANHVLTPGRLEEAFARVIDLHWDCRGILGADSVAMILSQRRRFKTIHCRSAAFLGDFRAPLRRHGFCPCRAALPASRPATNVAAHCGKFD